MSNEKLRAFYDDRRKKGPGLIALGVVGVINWIVSDVLNFSSLVSQLNIDLSGFKQVANVLLPDFGLFGTLFVVTLICWLFDWDRLTRAIIFIANGIATFLVANYAFDLLLSITKRSGNRDAAFLMIDAVLVWLMNLIVFTIWYWLLDRGGPDRRGTPGAAARLAVSARSIFGRGLGRLEAGLHRLPLCGLRLQRVLRPQRHADVVAALQVFEHGADSALVDGGGDGRRAGD